MKNFSALQTALKSGLKISVSTLSGSIKNSPPANTILYYLRTKFKLERLERVANNRLR